MLVIHGGAFITGDPDGMAPQVAIARRLAPDAEVRSVGYPLGSPTRAYRAVRRVARRHDGPVVAYGFSAGGYLAARLAARGDVLAAASFAGLYDLDAFARRQGNGVFIRAVLGVLTPEGRRSVVLVRGADAAPNLLLHRRADPIAPFGPARRYARRHRGVRLVEIPGARHPQTPRPVRRALRWLVRQARAA